MKFCYLFVLLFLANCSNSEMNCEIDSKFEKYFKNSLETIRIHQEEQIGSKTPFNIEKALKFLEIMTEKKSSISVNPFGIFYNRTDDYENDMKMWNEWFEQNKCDLSKEKVDSIYSKYRNEKKASGTPDSLINKYYPENWKNFFD